MALSAKDRRALRLLLLVILPAFAFAFGARGFVRALGGRGEQTGQQLDLLAREQAAVADAPTLASRTRDVTRRLNERSASLLIGAPRVALVSELTDRVRSIARQQEVLVTQLSELPSDSLGDGWSTLRVSVRGESDLAGIARLLRAIERDRAQLRVARLLIERPEGSFAGGGPAATDGRLVLNVNVVIEALAHAAADGSAGR